MRINKIIIKEDQKFYWAEKDFHTQYGLIKENILKKSKPGIQIDTGTGSYVSSDFLGL